MADSTFRGIIQFFDKLGVYDVILPFILIFSVVFAILEKSKILGTVKIGSNTYTKKNINAMVAFVIAFFVVASTQLVGVLNQALGQIALLMVVSISFLMLIGTFFSNAEEVYLKEGGWRLGFMIAMLIGTILIFAGAIKTKDGDSWLAIAWEYLTNNWDNNVAGSIILVAVLILLMYYITKDRKEDKPKDSAKG